jgi:hypothetical protein
MPRASEVLTAASAVSRESGPSFQLIDPTAYSGGLRFCCRNGWRKKSS